MSNIKVAFPIIQISLFLSDFGYRCVSRSFANVVEKLVHGSFVSLRFTFDLLFEVSRGLLGSCATRHTLLSEVFRHHPVRLYATALR